MRIPLTAFGNTTSSAYLRLVPNQEAPTRICWSDLNRSAMIRVPLGWAHGGNLARQINPQQSEDYTDPQGGR
jgi:glutamine synthetase